MDKLHWAFIMDCNGRWAKLRGIPRKNGHIKGVETASRVVDFCLKCGEVSVVSLYVFSTENWRRPSIEISGLFSLARQYISRIDEFVSKGVKVVFSSALDGLPKDLTEKMEECTKKTQHCKNITLNLCLNYGGRAEILRAAKLLAEKNKLKNATEDDFLKEMYQDLPCPDLILRTGGQVRLSNFLMFQSAYTELFFSDVLWPDLTEEDLLGVLNAFKKRIRNFVKVN